MVEIKEVDQTGAVIDSKWESMRRELHETRQAIQLALQQLINMRKEQVAYKIYLDKELGTDVDPNGVLPYKPTWKDRSLEKTYLKSELVSLVDRLQALDPKFRFDPNCLPSTLSTSREVLLTDRQMEDLVVLYQNYNVYRSENERKAAEAFKDYLRMRNEYEIKLLHNNAMIDEINDTRKRIKELKTQAVEDKCFMKFLVTFKLYEERPTVTKASESMCTQPHVVDVNARASESKLQKYKALWQRNLEDKECFRQCLESLEERLEDAHSRIVRAERTCMNNAALVQELELKVHTELTILSGQDHGGAEDSFKRVYWGVAGQLMAARNENDHTRRFLQKVVLPKEKDFLKLLSSLEAKAGHYRKEIVEATPKPPEPEPVEEKKPDSKAKGKKKSKKKSKKKK